MREHAGRQAEQRQLLAAADHVPIEEGAVLAPGAKTDRDQQQPEDGQCHRRRRSPGRPGVEVVEDRERGDAMSAPSTTIRNHWPG